MQRTLSEKRRKRVSPCICAESSAGGRAPDTASTPSPVPQSLLDFLAEREAAATRIRRIPVRNGDRIVFVSADEIDWVEAAGNYVLLHVCKETHILRDTMSALESQLPADAFLRVSRSAIVNLHRINELQSIAPGEHIALLTDAQRIPITRPLREVEERLRFA